MMAWMRRRISKKMADRGVRHFKVTEANSGDLVAWARWDVPAGSTHFGEWIDTEQDIVDVSNIVKSEPEPASAAQWSQEICASAPAVAPQVTSVDIPEGADPFVTRNFFDAIAGASEKWYTDDMLGKSSLRCERTSIIR
jgi:hypothetical protein